MRFDVPRTARVCVPVDTMTATRLAAFGVEVETTRPPRGCKRIVVVEVDPSSPLATLAGERCDAVLTPGSVLELDVACDARQLEDSTPPIPSDVPGPDRFPLWEQPRSVQYDPPPLHLPAGADPADLEPHVLAWLESLPPSGTAEMPLLLARWQEQADRLLSHATARAASDLDDATPDERQAALRRLRWLAHLVRGGDYDVDEHVTWDEEADEPRAMTRTELITHAYNGVLAACDNASRSGGERSYSGLVLDELKMVAEWFADDLSERLQLARRAGLLAESLGVARTELLALAWPGWRYLRRGEQLKPVRNPSVEALRALDEARSETEGVRPWSREVPSLSWSSPSECAVLVSRFLGQTIVKDVEA